MSPRLFALFFTGIIFASSANTAAGQPVDNLWLSEPSLISAGERALVNGRLDRAERLFREALDEPLTRDMRQGTYNNLCITNYLAGDYDEALAACNAALDLKAKDWRALTNRGNIHMARGNYEQAAADYHAALRLRPGEEVLRRNLAMAERSYAQNQ